MRNVRCPTCRTAVSWEGNPHRPFCSDRCRVLDLGAWASERYRIAGDPVPLEDTDPDDDVPRR
ncbi:MAG: DNA gyrase inhibitor YacG [Candidatus Binatia bacterium]